MNNVTLNYLGRFTADGSGQLPTVYMIVEGKLTEVKLVKIEYAVLSETAEARATIMLPNGKRKSVPEKEWGKLFGSVKDYEANKPIAVKSKCLYNISNYSNADGATPHDGQLRWWYMKDGEPKEQVIDIDDLTLDYSDYNKWVLPDDYVPHGYHYKTREDCLSFNEYVSVDKDGKETIHTGKNMLVRLDDDQCELLDDLRDALKKLTDAGVVLVADTMEGVQAFNVREVKDWAFGPDRSYIDDEEREKYDDINRYAPEFAIELPVSIWADDCTLWIKRKDSDQ